MSIGEKYTWLKNWYCEHRAELQSQPAMVSAIKNDDNVETTIRDLYFALFNQSLGGCGSCLADALIVLYHYPETEITRIMECNFKLRSGVLLMDSTGRLPHVTAANLTDELAIAYLRDNMSRIDMFESYPDNIDELVSDDMSAQNDEPEQTHVDAEKPAENASIDATGEPKRRTRTRK